MKVRIKLLKPFSDAAGTGEVDLELSGENVMDMLNTLCEKYPKLKDEIFNKQGEVDFTVNIFVNDKPITALQDVDTILSDGDEILIFMPVGGG